MDCSLQQKINYVFLTSKVKDGFQSQFSLRTKHVQRCPFLCDKGKVLQEKLLLLFLSLFSSVGLKFLQFHYKTKLDKVPANIYVWSVVCN